MYQICMNYPQFLGIGKHSYLYIEEIKISMCFTDLLIAGARWLPYGPYIQ